VLVRRRNVQVGSYWGGGKAFVVHAKMIVVDLARKRVIATRSFVSGQPPMTAEMGFDAEGPLPVRKVLAWIAAMAKR
jgi:hypothetical protein